MRWAVFVLVLITAGSAVAQETWLQSEFRREGEHVKGACGNFSFKSVGGCAIELFTDHPLHIAAGSIAPQNGFGLGGAFVAHHTPNENWRISWSADAVGSMNGSWRAGGYVKFIHTPVKNIVVSKPKPKKPGDASVPSSPTISVPKPKLAIEPSAVFNLYVQTISLNKLNFFGLGPDSPLAGRSVFGLTETIVGGSVIKPVTEWEPLRKLHVSLVGEVNGRFVNLRGNHSESSPSIEQLYDEATAPGLATQPGVVQLVEGVRIKPVLFDNYLHLNYLATFQQYFAPSNSHYSFLRWTVDLGHTINLYGLTQSGPRDANGPNDCRLSLNDDKCPDVNYSRNLNGSIGVRLLISESMTSGSSVVPFYFQQTLGGSDINGAPSLGSYQDYRFRGPNVFLLRESFEHSIWGPFGFVFMADQGKVALTRGDIGFDHLKHSFATGLTLRAGGFPAISFMYAWGGNEGHHNIFNMNTSLLGGSARPKLD